MTCKTRVESYEDLAEDIVRWLKDYYWMYSLKSFVVGVSGGIDSAVALLYVQGQGYQPMWFVCL